MPRPAHGAFAPETQSRAADRARYSTAYCWGSGLVSRSASVTARGARKADSAVLPERRREHVRAASPVKMGDTSAPGQVCWSGSGREGAMPRATVLSEPPEVV